jgi:hypothetical protein
MELFEICTSRLSDTPETAKALKDWGQAHSDMTEDIL